MKRDCIFFSFYGFLFCFFTATGRELAGQGNILWSGSYVLRLLCFCAAGGICLGVFCALAGRFVPVLCAKAERFWREAGRIRAHPGGESAGTGGERQSGGSARRKLPPWRLWLLGTAILILCWLPGYLAYYPGICAYDVTVQTGQVVSGAYNDHHPIAHTLLLGAAMKLGEAVFDSANTGLAVLVFVQMSALAAAVSWGICLLRRRGALKIYCLALLIFGMFYPFHHYMSISVSKDVFFSLFFLLQMLALCEMIRNRNADFCGSAVLFAAASIGMQLFRNNGRYAMLVLFAVLLCALVFGRGARRFWGKLALNCGVSLLLGSLLLSGLFRITGAEQGDRREMLSMPIQQLARCMLYHGGVEVLAEDDNSMEERDKALIDDFLLDESYREYRPDIADPVKRHTNTYVVRYRTGDFVHTYLNLLCEYPGDFINAALAVNAGYLYIGDESHASINENGIDRGLGYVQTRWVEEELNPRGLYKDSKWESLHERMEKWADENAYRKLPVLRYLFVPGTVLWLYLGIAAYLAARKRYDRCVPLALAAGYYLTLFLGPTVQLRYIYPLTVALPFMAWMMLAGAKSGKDGRKIEDECE
ncbi:MAG: DUF6020 family protein [Muribaculum sp.]|nr:DUF6020 family protein [Muribaculum sp.]